MILLHLLIHLLRDHLLVLVLFFDHVDTCFDLALFLSHLLHEQLLSFVLKIVFVIMPELRIPVAQDLDGMLCDLDAVREHSN